MRGKASSAPQWALISGITPAYAGKSLRERNTFVQPQDHPRLCGEKIMPMQIFRMDIGSPPPMRGKDAGFSFFVDTVRITPAYAGKRNENEKLRSVKQDHPRLCGEKGTLGIFIPGSLGSPPPMRGKDAAVLAAGDTPRITPAYAGKSQRPHISLGIVRDHPRLCGEKNHRQQCNSMRRGKVTNKSGYRIDI